MIHYPYVWLGAIIAALVAAVVVTGLGCYLTRTALNDLSNSTTFQAYLLRFVRIAPGLVIAVFGSLAVSAIVEYILRFRFP
jgi:hypothetical protein